MVTPAPRRGGGVRTPIRRWKFWRRAGGIPGAREQNGPGRDGSVMGGRTRTLSGLKGSRQKDGDKGGGLGRKQRGRLNQAGRRRWPPRAVRGRGAGASGEKPPEASVASRPGSLARREGEHGDRRAKTRPPGTVVSVSDWDPCRLEETKREMFVWPRRKDGLRTGRR